jgi:flagellar biosynthesis anti-sigma factor FlgM
MRIELNTQDTQLISAERTQKPTPAAISQSGPSPADDKTTLSQDSVTISNLAAQALGQPEIRQSLVDSLRQSINSGQYRLDAGEIADAMLSR